MQTKNHPLASNTLGTAREVVSFHFGKPGVGEKIYIQASLHADELPGMLVAHHLRKLFTGLEARGEMLGEIVLVPVANPVGLSQMLLHSHLGRFETATGENFNRHYPFLCEGVAERVATTLGTNAIENVKQIRAAMRETLSALQTMTEVPSLRKTLLSLACDADVVLDLHCDCDAVIHLYAGTPLWPQTEPLARYLGAHATLLATESGDCPFDEACSQAWWQLAERFPDKPIPNACLSVTVELRGVGDVDHALASHDAAQIVAFLQHRGVIAGSPPPMPPLLHSGTPLAGSESIIAPTSGVVTFLKRAGDWIHVGDVVAEIINPLTTDVHRVASKTEGVLYAQENRHFAITGMWLCKVAGAKPFRTGKLLSA
jgi:uncharacterized protein